MKLKLPATIALALAVATPLLFNTKPVQAEPTLPEAPPPAEARITTFAPFAAYAAGAAFLQLAMRIAAAEVATKGTSTMPIIDGSTATKAFD